MKFSYLLFLFALVSVKSLKAQDYVNQVSKDSLAILNGRIDALKASQKVQELKIEESKEEDEVEKLRVKLLEANDKAKRSAAANSKHTEKLSNGANFKETAKLAKAAKNDMQDSQKALDRYRKQIEKVEKLRQKIKAEEQKLGYKTPAVIFVY